MKKSTDAFPFIVCGGLIVLSGLLVVLGHRQGDAKAVAAAAATAAAPPKAPTTAAAKVTVTPNGAAAASAALAKPGAAD